MFLLAGIVLLAIAIRMTWTPRSFIRPHQPLMPPLSPTDRLLVLAPHEDDETLGAGGAIQQALATGAQVRVVFLTYGDHNEVAFMLYKKEPFLTSSGNRQMGETRRREALAATQALGLSSNQLVFLGYPDLGTLFIWEEHWDKSAPFYSLLTDTREVPYADAYSAGRAYKGENIMIDLQRQVEDFRPTRILVTHPADRHPDHQAYYLYINLVLFNLEGRLPPPSVYCYPVHAGQWPTPADYDPANGLPLPPALVTPTSPGFMSMLEGAQVRTKANAIRLYKSQTVNSEHWMLSFARQNELFTQPQFIQLTSFPSPTNAAHATWEAQEEEAFLASNGVSGVTYNETKSGLEVHVTFRSLLGKEAGLFLHLHGYRKDIRFPEMPKLNIYWRPGMTMVSDQAVKLSSSSIAVYESGRQITFKIPWVILNDPTRLFAQAHGMLGTKSVSQTSWQILVRQPVEGHP
ncbi:MAG: hypothetical protein A2X46_00720 [Lentisphaerae bacterium GWF2_57_35]|nr:MAG: hypothetical protein A2X46_00720 [Lentisphaerae bacterium GWF2_57_35]